MPKQDHRLRNRLKGRTGNAFVLAPSLVLLLLIGAALIYLPAISGQTIQTSSTVFRIGEKLSYNISFGRIPNAGYAETHVVSRGKISGKDAVEIRARVKTVDIVSAAFFLFDESRTAFAAPDTGLPHYVTTSSLDAVTPKETIQNYINQPTSNFDLLTLIYKVRDAGGVGSFPLFEGEQMHTVTLQGAAPEKVKTDAGSFDTTVALVQSDFLAAANLKDLRINFSTDEYRIPVLVRFKTAKGEFKVSLAAITLPEPEVLAPSPTPIANPSPTAAPKPTATPVQYVENQPLLPELGFMLGEVLDYRITSAGKPLGILTLNARERKLIDKRDTLLLTATVTSVEPGEPTVRLGDGASVQVDPDTLTPIRIDSKFLSTFVGLNQSVTFDQRTGIINFGGKQPADSPVGTHSFVSLLYAMRSFNLKPSKDASNPVNDTRVAVFWENKSYVFTLRPSEPAEWTNNGETVSAQLITINTGNKELDALNLKVWLRTEDRTPLRLSAGAIQADLIATSNKLF